MEKLTHEVPFYTRYTNEGRNGNLVARLSGVSD